MRRAAAVALRHPLTWLYAWFLVLPFLMNAVQSTVSLGTEIVLFSLLAIAYNLLMGYTGLVSFGHGAFFGIGGYAAGLTQIHFARGMVVLTKADLVERVTAQIARTAGPMISKKDCARVVDSFLDAIKEALQQQKNIEVRGFGTFKIRQRKTRMARNPRTGAPVEVSARPVPVFKPSKELRAMVAGTEIDEDIDEDEEEFEELSEA